MYNRTKIIVTTGPSTRSYEIMAAMVKAGVDVFRLNFSHASYEQHEEVIKNVRKINLSLGTNVGIIADLQGPKLRLGDLHENMVIKPGDRVRFTTKKSSTPSFIPITYPKFASEVKKGDSILIDDGNVQLVVTETNGKDAVEATVINGKVLASRKGVNLPGTRLSVPSLTNKDLKDLAFALSRKVNWVALSFVRSAADIRKIRKITGPANVTKIIAKIEKSEAVAAIDEIIHTADAIMVARGDLGVEVPIENMPLIQKQIVRKCIQASKPVIIATQIMDSMIRRPGPTRAEVNDIANAVFDGADALMLSGETSVGNYPLETVMMMDKVLKSIEKEKMIYNRNLLPDPASETFLSDAICFNACRIADEVNAKAIICMTRSGFTGFLVASYRPRASIYVFTDNDRLPNAMSLTWGTRAFFYDKFVSTDRTITDVKKILKRKGLVKKGDVVINLASMPIGEQSRTNMVKVSKIE